MTWPPTPGSIAVCNARSTGACWPCSATPRKPAPPSPSWSIWPPPAFSIPPSAASTRPCRSACAARSLFAWRRSTWSRMRPASRWRVTRRSGGAIASCSQRANPDVLLGFNLPRTGVDYVELSWRSLPGGALDVDFPPTGLILTDIPDLRSLTQARARGVVLFSGPALESEASRIKVFCFFFQKRSAFFPHMPTTASRRRGRSASDRPHRRQRPVHGTARRHRPHHVPPDDGKRVSTPIPST